MVPAFSPSSGNGLGIYYVWYIILAVEFGLIIGLSTIWRQLSFKKTHLMERMGLLTLMVIGEGAIGVTKTIAKVMGKTGGLTVEGCGLVICIVLIMVNDFYSSPAQPTTNHKMLHSDIFSRSSSGCSTSTTTQTTTTARSASNSGQASTSLSTSAS